MKVLILICVLQVNAEDCHKDNAISVFFAPDLQRNAASCMMHGMLFVAQSRMVKEGTYPKIVCDPGRSLEPALADSE